MLCKVSRWNRRCATQSSAPRLSVTSAVGWSASHRTANNGYLNYASENARHAVNWRLYVRKMIYGISLSLALLLTGCAGTGEPRTVTVTETEYRYPPDAWLQPCVAPPFKGERMGDILEHVSELRAEIARCNVNMMMLREWRDDASESEQD